MLGQIGRAAMVPLWTAQLLTGAKSFERNPVIGSRRLNQWGLHAARVRFAQRVAAARRNRLAGLVSPADREDFARDGFVIRRNFMPAAEFAALLGQLQTYRGMLREIAEGDTVLRKIALGREVLAALPALGALLRSPEWRGLIRYIGSRDAEPVVWIQSILRHAVDGRALLTRDPAITLLVAMGLAERLNFVTTYLADLKNQYADAPGLQMVSDVMRQLAQLQGPPARPGSARDPEPRY